MKQLQKAIDAGWRVTSWRRTGEKGCRVSMRRYYDQLGFIDLDGRGKTLGKAIKDALKGDYSG